MLIHSLVMVLVVSSSLLSHHGASGLNVVSVDAVERPNDIILGDESRGRDIYHKIGGCAFCHGINGDLTRRPPLSRQLRQQLKRLNPPPANLRDIRTLKSQDDVDRFRSIKFGHPGTAMFPKPFLTDVEIRHVLAYLRGLRGE